MGGVGNEGPTPGAGPLAPGNTSSAAVLTARDGADEAKMSKEIDEEGGWDGGGEGRENGPPSAAAYDSEEDRIAALAPQTDAEILMKERRMKADKLIAKKTSTTTALNPRKVRTLLYCCLVIQNSPVRTILYVQTTIDIYLVRAVKLLLLPYTSY